MTMNKINNSWVDNSFISVIVHAVIKGTPENGVPLMILGLWSNP